jgi:hypothetical protein
MCIFSLGLILIEKRMTIALPSQRIQWIIIAATFLVVHLACYLIYKDRPLDDAQHYLDAAILLLEEGKIDEHFHVLYFIPIALLSICTWLFSEPVAGFVMFQIGVSAVAVVALYRTTEAISTQTAAFFSALIFVLWIDIVRWNVLVMTDSLFGSITIFVLNRFLMRTHLRRYALELMLMLIIGIFTRPVGILLIIAVGASAIVGYAKRHSVSRSVITIFVLALGGCTIILAYYLSLSWDFTDQYFRGNVITYADTYTGDKSWIHFDPHYTDTSNQSPILKTLRFIVQRPIHVILVSLLKFLYLVSGIRPYYSASHNLFTLIWMTVVYTGVINGLKVMSRSAFKTPLLALIIGNCLLVTMTTVDWDNRFYIPMEGAVVILSAVGLSNVVSKRRQAG